MTLALALLLALQGPTEWEKFGPGSSAEYLTTGKRDGADVRTTERSLFKEATATDVVISLETVDASGARSTVDMRFPLPQRQVPKEDPGVKTGDEKLILDGRTFDCEVFERKGMRRWVCAAATANGGVLKTESISGTVLQATRVVKFEEKIKVGDATLTCWALEEVTQAGDQMTIKTTWKSDAVPGGMVRQKVRQTRGLEAFIETVTTLTAFHVVKK